MNTSLRQRSVRSSVSLLGASLLASSALFVASAGAMAAPAPSVTFVNASCSGTVGRTIDFDVNVSAKGKWVSLVWSTRFDSDGFAVAGSNDRWNSDITLSVSDFTFVNAGSAQARVEVLDKKGGVIASADSVEVDC